MKNIWVYLSILLGALFSLWSYAYWMPGLFPMESGRMLVAVGATFVLGSGVGFYTLTRFVLPRVKEFSCKTRILFEVTCLLFGACLLISSVDFHHLRASTLYFLLPEHSLKINATGGINPTNEKITLQGFSTSVREISYHEFEINGWIRMGDQLQLDNSLENHLIWTGKTGSSTQLVFETSPEAGKIDLTWDGNHVVYDLYSPDIGFKKIVKDFPVPFFAGWVPLAFFMLVGYCLGVGVIFLGVLGLRLRLKPIPVRRFDWLKYAAPMLAVWGFYLLVFFPGFMSADSMAQWREMLTGHYVDWQPPFHSMLIWLITRVWYSPAAVGVVQIIALSGVLGWGLAVIRRLGTPAWVVWLTTAILVVSPANSVYSITLWKDIPFAIVVTALTIMALQIVTSRGEWFKSSCNILMLGIILALVSLLRQNGILVSIGMVLLLVIRFAQSWRKITISLLVFLVLYGFVKGVIFRVEGIAPNNMARLQLVTYNLVAAHLDGGTTFTVGERKFATGAFPDEEVPYYCFRNTNLTSKVDRNYLIENTLPLLNLAWQLTLRSPVVTLNHFICNGAFTFRIFEYLGYYETAWLVIVPNRYAIIEASLVPSIKPWMTAIIKSSADQNGMNWLIWRSPVWMYLLAAGVILSSFRKKRWEFAMVFLPAFLAILPLPLLSLGQIFRYVYSMYLCGILLSGYFWVSAASEDSDQ